MKKKLLFAFVTAATLNLVFGTIYCNAQTSIAAGNVSGTWTLSGSPYNVQGHIQIDSGYTLTIQAGVTVNFQGHYKFNVQGRLLAIGTSTDSIVFTPTNTSSGWWGIRFSNTSSSQDSSIFKYCKIQYGNANTSGDNASGGGFFIKNFSKIRISNCLICNNTCLGSGSTGGGGISLNSSSAIITNSTISNNIASSGLSYIGGGIACAGGNPVISNNIITNNSTNGYGGGIGSNGSAPIIINNVISNNNTSMWYGGGIYLEISPAILTGNVITNNTCSHNGGGYGGGVACISSSPAIITNCTIANNSVQDAGSGGGGGLYCTFTSNPVLKNVIFWGNTATSGNGNDVYLDDIGSVNTSFFYCNGAVGSAGFYTSGNSYTGTHLNNINSDPLFVSPSGGSGAGFNGVSANWSLQAGSPCIDNGDPSANGSSLDIINNPRISNCRIDMGAYEYQNGTAFSVTIAQTSSILCFGQATGTLQATASGNGLPYTFLWSPGGETTSAISNLSIGTYTVTATNSNACTISAIKTITEPASIPLHISSTGLNCPGQCTGSATATIANGITGPYTYLWNTSPTQNTSVTSATLCLGTYSVTVTDNLGCTTALGVTIGADSAALTLSDSVTNASCYNAGSASVTANGGAAPYSYLWSNGNQNFNLTGIGKGTYSVTVTDNAGCVISDTLIVYSNNIAPSSIPICMVTVDSTSTKNVIVWEKPTDVPIDSFKIYREIASAYVHIGSVAYSALSEFTDNSNGINPNTTSYKYKLSVLDTCGNESTLSPNHQTVHVQLGVAFPSGVNLIWNDYVGFSFLQYRILRDDSGNGNWHALDSVSFGITTYTSADVLPNARYMVEANRPTTCVSTRQAVTRNSSKSNTASQTTGINELANDMAVIIYPNPTNGKFIIELSSPPLKNDKCEIKIYNMLGEKVFQSSNLNQQTSKEINLSASPKGIYFVRIYDGEKNHSKKIVVQ
ncbi:MAG: T9SS type A sorting domain-containing protein [Bacteroidota bacterium]